MNFLDKIYTRSDAVVSRKIAGELILVPVRKGAGNLESIYTMNETGARIWELIDGKTNVRKIKEKIIEEFGATAEEAVKDTVKIIEYLRQLEEIKAIREG